MATNLVVTHIEYHPVGNESVAVGCRAVARGNSGVLTIIGGATEPKLLHKGHFEEKRSELFELSQPIRVDSNSVVVAFGAEYVDAVMAIEDKAKGKFNAIEIMRNLPTQRFGVRLWAGSPGDGSSLREELGGALIRAFDGNLGSVDADKSFSRLLWELISKESVLKPLVRIVRGMYLFEQECDSKRLDKLLVDAELFDRVARDVAQEEYEEYKKCIASCRELADH